jgi:hypothetical protein
MKRFTNPISFLANSFILSRALLIIAAFALLAFFLPEPKTLSFVTAKTNSVKILVTNPDMMRLQANAFLIKGEGASGVIALPKCIVGLIKPTKDTLVTYRYLGEHMSVSLERDDGKPAVEFIGFTGKTYEPLMKSGYITLTTAECGEEPPKRLPVFGAIEIGEELKTQHSVNSASSYPLIEGTIKTYGQSMKIKHLEKWMKSSLYQVSEMDIPPGARVYQHEKDKNLAGWTGFITITEYDGMQVNVTTSAPKIAYQITDANSEPYVVEISNLSQMMNDPIVIIGQLLFLVLISLKDTIFRRKKPDAND